jgi:hypothetical protein
MQKNLSLPLRHIVVAKDAGNNVHHEVKNGKHRLVNPITEASTDWVE